MPLLIVSVPFSAICTAGLLCIIIMPTRNRLLHLRCNFNLRRHVWLYQGRLILIFLVWFLEFVFPLQGSCVPYFHVRIRGGRQGPFDCELQFAIFNALCFLRLSALQLAHWVCSLSPQFAPFTGRCSFWRLWNPQSFIVFSSLFVTPANLSLDVAPPPFLYGICIDFCISPYKPANIRTKKVSIVRCEQIHLLKHTRLAAE